MAFFSRLFGSGAGHAPAAAPTTPADAEKRAFFARVVAALRERHPTMTLEPDLATFKIAARKDGHGSTILLHNAWAHEQVAKAARARGEEGPLDGIAYLLAGLQTDFATPKLSRLELLRRVQPMLVPKGADGDTLVRAPLVTDALELALAVDLSERILWVDKPQLEEVGRCARELIESALANLASKRPEQDEISMRVLGDEPVAAFLLRKDMLASSWVFHRPFGESLRRKFPRGYVIAVPTRELLIVLAPESPAFGELAALAAREYAKSPRPLCEAILPHEMYRPLDLR